MVRPTSNSSSSGRKLPSPPDHPPPARSLHGGKEPRKTHSTGGKEGFSRAQEEERRRERAAAAAAADDDDDDDEGDDEGDAEGDAEGDGDPDAIVDKKKRKSDVGKLLSDMTAHRKKFTTPLATYTEYVTIFGNARIERGFEKFKLRDYFGASKVRYDGLADAVDMFPTKTSKLSGGTVTYYNDARRVPVRLGEVIQYVDKSGALTEGGDPYGYFPMYVANHMRFFLIKELKRCSQESFDRIRAKVPTYERENKPKKGNKRAQPRAAAAAAAADEESSDTDESPRKKKKHRLDVNKMLLDFMSSESEKARQFQSAEAEKSHRYEAERNHQTNGLTQRFMSDVLSRVISPHNRLMAPPSSSSSSAAAAAAATAFVVGRAGPGRDGGLGGGHLGGHLGDGGLGDGGLGDGGLGDFHHFGSLSNPSSPRIPSTPGPKSF